MRVAPALTLSEEDRQVLESWSRGRSTPARLVQRARIVLPAAGGMENIDIAREVGTDRQTVGPRRTGFVREGIAGLKRYLTRTFKLSNDPNFVEKLVDVVGLYLNPPERAPVLSADEKSRVRALNRTQPSPPLMRGRAGTMTHDSRRNGITTLFAAMELADGKVVSACMKRHRHQEWTRFLRLIDGQTPADLDLRVIADNYAARKHPKVKSWLRRHPRFHMHFIPTSSSWLTLIERFFRAITDRQIRRDSFTGVRPTR